MALLSRRYKPNLTLNFKELEDFERRLKVLHGMTVKHRRREMQKITTYALRPTKKIMKQLAPKGKTGSLKKSITTAGMRRIGLGSRVGSRTGAVLRGKSKRRVYHAHRVALGSRRKRKRVGKGKNPFTFYSVRYRKVLRLRTIHHGSKAQPFVRPAYQRTKDMLVPRMKERLKPVLMKLMHQRITSGRKVGRR